MYRRGATSGYMSDNFWACTVGVGWYCRHIKSQETGVSHGLAGVYSSRYVLKFKLCISIRICCQSRSTHVSRYEEGWHR